MENIIECSNCSQLVKEKIQYQIDAKWLCWNCYKKQRDKNFKKSAKKCMRGSLRSKNKIMVGKVAKS